MNATLALRTGVRLLWERSASVLPVYLFATGLYGIARIPFVLAGLVAFALVSTDGRLARLVEELEGFDAPGPGAGAADPGAVPPGLTDAVTDLLGPDVLALVAVGLLGSLALSVVVSAAGSAAAINALLGLLRDEDGVRAAVVGMGDDWLTLLGVRLLLVAALAAVTVPSVLGVLAAAAASPTLALAVGILAGALSVLLLLGVLLLFAFAEQAVVVDGRGAFGAVRRSAGFPFRRPGAFVGYVAVVVGSIVLTGVLGGAASLVGMGRVPALVGAVVIPPVLDGFKTALYAERELAERETPGVGDRLRGAFVGGLRELGAFVREHPVANAASAAIFAVAIAAGWVTTASLDVRLPVEGEVSNVFGTFPVGTFVNLAVNNWLVAADAAYSGVAVGIPTVTSLALNGVLVGALGGVFDPVSFVALVAPHGVVEIPALVLGGGLGLWLGGVGFRAVRGRTGATGVAAALRRTYRVLLGLVPLFVVAAFIEAFLTPFVASLVVGV